jgi:DNA-binding NarL/FixJ family response regulator
VALRILIADDDVEIRRLVSFVIRQDPALVLIGEAVDGDAALVLAGRHRPDIVLMDIMMPRVGGLEATRRIKREWPATKVLVLTSLNDDETRCAAFVNGADSFLNKRDIATRLLQAIRDATRAA